VRLEFNLKGKLYQPNLNVMVRMFQMNTDLGWGLIS